MHQKPLPQNPSRSWGVGAPAGEGERRGERKKERWKERDGKKGREIGGARRGPQFEKNDPPSSGYGPEDW